MGVGVRPPIIFALGRVTPPPDGIVVDCRAGCFVKDGLIVPRKPKVTTRFRIFAAMLAIQERVTYDEFFEAVWGDNPEASPLQPENYIACALANSSFKHPVTRQLVLVREWLGFRVRSYYDKAYRVTWSSPVPLRPRDVYAEQRLDMVGVE